MKWDFIKMRSGKRDDEEGRCESVTGWPAYSDPIIVGNLSDLCMNKFSIFNFLFVFVTQWRSIVLNCIQNFCLLSMVSVISCRPKKKKKIVGFRKTFLITLLLATHADV